MTANGRLRPLAVSLKRPLARFRLQSPLLTHSSHSFCGYLTKLIPRLFAAFLFLTAGISAAAESDERAIQETYDAWVEATNRKNIEEWSSFLAMNPYFVPADSPPLSNTEEITNYYARSFADPRFSLDCKQEHVDVAESGDMAWSRGSCNATFTGPDGEKASGTSRWFKVWIRQSDGSWRCRVNSWRNIGQL